MSPVVASVQNDFSRGAFPLQEDVPDGGVSMIVNGLLREDGGIERRGGVVEETTTPTDTAIVQVWDGALAAGQKTVMLTAGSIYRQNGASVQQVYDFAPVLAAAGAGSSLAFEGRPRGVGGAWVCGGRLSQVTPTAYTVGVLFVYAGAPPAGPVGSLAGLAVTQGARTATVTSTTNMRAGDVFLITQAGQTAMCAIQSVDSATQITLAEPFPFVLGSYSSVAPTSLQAVSVWSESGQGRPDKMFLATAGKRLFIGQGRRVDMTGYTEDANGVLRPLISPLPNEFHSLPDGATITGMDSLNGNIVVFTTMGVFVITNPELRIVDDDGNVQQALVQVNRDLRLWGDLGLATWQNTLLVPARDDLYLFVTSADAPQNEVRAVTGGARELYRKYVRAGHRPALAAVHEGHYLLPIVNAAGTPVDLLVWRVDQISRSGAPFVGSWRGGTLASTRALAVRSPGKILAACGSVLMDAAPAFSVENTHDPFSAAGPFPLVVTFRPLAASETQEHTVRRARMRYEIPGAGDVEGDLSWSKGPVGGGFTALSGTIEAGSTSRAWAVNKTAQMVWLRLTSDASVPMIVRALEVAAEPGRR